MATPTAPDEALASPDVEGPLPPPLPPPPRPPRGVGTLQWASDEAFKTAALESHKQAFDVVWRHFRAFRGRFPLDGYLHYIREDPARWLSLLPPPYRDPKGHMRKAVSAIYALQRSTPLRQVPDLPEAVGATVHVLRAAFKAAKAGETYVPETADAAVAEGGDASSGGSVAAGAPDGPEDAAEDAQNDDASAAIRDLDAMFHALEAVTASPDATAAALARLVLARGRRALRTLRG